MLEAWPSALSAIGKQDNDIAEGLVKASWAFENLCFRGKLEQDIGPLPLSLHFQPPQLQQSFSTCSHHDLHCPTFRPTTIKQNLWNCRWQETSPIKFLGQLVTVKDISLKHFPSVVFLQVLVEFGFLEIFSYFIFCVWVCWLHLCICTILPVLCTCVACTAKIAL